MKKVKFPVKILLSQRQKCFFFSLTALLTCLCLCVLLWHTRVEIMAAPAKLARASKPQRRRRWSLDLYLWLRPPSCTEHLNFVNREPLVYQVDDRGVMSCSPLLFA